MYIENINKGKNFLISALISTIAVLMGCAYDVIVAKYPITNLYVISHLVFFTSVAMLAFLNKKDYSFLKVMLIIALFSLLLILKTKYITILYSIAVLQVGFILTSLVILEKKLYLFLNFVLMLGTLFAIFTTSQVSRFLVITLEIKFFMTAIYLQMHLFMIFIYSLGIYPRVQQILTDLKFTSIGKSTSFIIHELSKPVGRLNSENAKEIPELQEIQEVLTIAQELSTNTVINSAKQSCNINKIIEERLTNYQSFLNYYNIQVQNHVPSHFHAIAPPRYLNIILDNLIKNAIEASKIVEAQSDRFIKIEVINGDLVITNSFQTTIDLSQIFEANSTSKVGNLGIGLYLCKNFCEVLDWNLKVQHQKMQNLKTFKVSLTF